MSFRSSFGSRRFVVGTVSTAHFASHFYILVFPPLFPLFKAEFGLSNTELGVLFSLLYLMPSILQVPVGDLVDRIGAKRIFVAGIGLTSLGTMSTTLANSYPALLGFVLVASVGQTAFHPANFALLETVTDTTNRGKAFGVHTFAGYLGFAAGPIAAGYLGVRFGWRFALASLGVFGLVYAVFVFLTLAPVHGGRVGEAADDSNEGSNWSQLADPRILLTFLFFVMITLSITGLQSFTVVFLTDVFELGVTVANSTLTATLAATALGVLAGGFLADRSDIYAILGGTMAVAALLIGVIVVGVVPLVVIAILAAFTILGLVHGLALPSRDSLVSEFSTSDSTGKSFGLAYTGVTIGATISPVVLGVVSDTLNNRVMFSLIGMFYVGAFLTIVLIYVLFVRPERRTLG